MVYNRTAMATPPTPLAKRNRINFPLTSYAVAEIRIAINSQIVAGYNAIDAVAIGKSISPDATFASYLWSPGGETTTTKTVSTSGTYKLTTTNSLGCQLSETVKVTDALTTPPTITAAGLTTFCQGDSVLLTSNQNTGNIWSNGATTKSIRVKTAGSYTVSYNDGSGCTVLTSAPTVVNVNPLPVVTIAGNLGICSGGTTTLDAGAGFSSYKWSTSATTRTISVTSASTYTVTVTNANGCKATASASTTASASPVPTITGATIFCQGSSTTLDAGAGFSSYSWSTGAITRTITANTAANFSVTVTNANGCAGTTSINSSLYTSPTPSIAGNSDICPGGSTTLTANSGYVSYSWSTGATSQSIPVNAAGTYTVTVTDANGCSASINKVVAQAATPTPVISGTLSFCASSSTTLEAGLGYSSYAWSNGASSHSIIVSTAGTYSVTVTNASGCAGTTSVTTTTTGAIPVSPAPITGNNGGVCNSINNVYSIAPVPNTAFYVWTVPVGATIVSGQGTTSITVNYGNTFSSGDIIVAASNACGQSPTNTARKLSITAIGATPGAITGQASGLCGQLNKVYSISPVAGTNTYLWTVPAGASIVGGQGTTSLTVNFTTNFGTGNICVKTINVCGNSANNCLALQGIPSAPTTINGPLSVCAKQSNVVYSVGPIIGANTYTWTLSNQGKILSGQGTTSIIVDFLNKDVDITVSASNGCGVSANQFRTITVGCLTNRLASNEDYESNEVSIFPNPSEEILNIKIENGFGKYNFKAINILGQLMYENDFLLENNQIKVDLKQLPKGVYIGRISNNKINESVKFILK
jgi:large repetitive protein